MSNSEEQSEPPVRTFQSITGNGTTSPTLIRTHTNGSTIHRSNTSSSRVHRTTSSNTHKETKDPNLDVNLPYRTFSDAANLEEYTQEKTGGEIPGPVEPNGRDRYKLVTFVPDDPANPKNWSKAFKWYCTMVGKCLRSNLRKTMLTHDSRLVAITCFVVAFCSAVITAGIIGPQKEFHVSEEVSLLAITVFVVGFGIGMQ